MIILTGSSGFLGQHFVKELQKERILSIGRTNAHLIYNLATQIPQLPAADLVIHSAGKAHIVPKTAQQKQEFFDVNVTGTKNLLKGLEQAPSLPKSFIFISSVSVYGLDKGKNIKETHPLN